MHKKHSYSGLMSAIQIVMSFVLSFLIFVFSYLLVVQTIMLNSDLALNVMDSSGYFIDKCDEIERSLTDLGYASGLDEEFFDEIIDETMLYSDTCSYLNNFYSGNGATVDDTAFKQKFNSELDEYIKIKNIKNVDQKNRDYLVRRGASIYRVSLELPLFGTLSGYIKLFGGKLIYIIIGIAVLIALLCLIIIKTNKWKHRAVRYICYAVSGSALAAIAFPAFVLISGFMNRLNMSSRAIYNLIVQYSNNLMVALLLCGGFLALVAVLLFLLCRSMRAKVS